MNCKIGWKTLALGISFCLCLQASAMDCPVGWAAVNALGQNGTTGGGNGPIVRVTTKAALMSYAGLSGPYTILVEGSFTNTGNLNVTSDKTIIGVGAGTTFDGFGISINTQSNIIIRNLTIRNVNPDDAIAMRTTHHVWIDHCDLSACTDGLADITIGSDYVTVSWTRFHNHDKVTLVNSGTQHFEDVGKCRVTYHHNWFYDTVQRNPRIGYGKSHVYNNYYTNISSYCVGYHTGASVLVESNYFLSSNNPLQQSYTSNPWEAAYADARSVGNIFNACAGTMSGTGISFNPEYYYHYKFALDTATNALALVKASAGPAATNTAVLCPTPGNGAIDVYAQTNDVKWTDAEGATSWDVYFGTTISPAFQTNKITRTFSPGTLAADTDYYWRVDAHTSGGVVTGDLWRFRTALTNASKPFPADGELHAPLRINDTYYNCKPLELAWTPGIGAASYRVYLGTNATLTEGDFRGSVTSPVYAPGPLKYGVTYYWRIDTVKGGGSVVPGDTWNFTSDITYSGPGRTEAENMVRNGTYYRENDTGWFAASQSWTVRVEDGPGTVSSVWSGANAVCKVKVNYFDENDGTGWFGFYVNETRMADWFASANNNQLMTNQINNVRINNGDELRIAVYSNSGELNRTDCMDIEVVNTAPALAAISNRTINVGVNLSITNLATDADPTNTLAFSLITTVTNAAINTSNGVFAWRPLVTQANTTNQFAVVVTDNGTPSLSATQNFNVVVNPLTQPAIALNTWTGGRFSLSVNGQAGPDYAVQVSSNLSSWNTVLITNSPAMPFSWIDPDTNNYPARFYRIKLGPPLP